MMSAVLRPIDRFPLGLERGENVIRMIFDDVIVDVATFGAAFRARFNIDVRQRSLILLSFFAVFPLVLIVSGGLGG